MAVQFTVMSIDDDQITTPKKSVFEKNEISIGRSRLNDLVLDHPGVSNTHARIRVDVNDGPAKFFISDLDSTNGTMVGNKRLDPRVEISIPEKDRIMIAGFIVKIENIADDAVPPAERIGKVTNGHAKRSPTMHVAFDGKDTSSYVKPDEPVSEEMPTPPPPPPPAVEEKITETPPEQTMIESAPILENEPTSVPSFAAEASLLVDDGDVELDFVATALLTLSGTITHKGQGLAGVTVSDSELGETTTDDTGRFEFRDILEGTSYDLTFYKPTFILAPKSATGTLMDQNISLEISGKKLFSISGKITHKGKALAGVSVDGGKLGVILTDGSGVYRFDNVPEGEEHTLKASKDGYTFGTVRKVT